MNSVARWIITTDQQSFNVCFWDGQVVNSNGLDPGSNVDNTVFITVDHTGDVDSSWGNTAEHSSGALPQHPLEGKYLGLILYLSS